MSPKIKLDLSESGCQKPGCKHKFSTPNRHHVRHEKTWLNLWDNFGISEVGLSKEERRRIVLLLKARYFQFRPQDTVRICENHHVEIHAIYAEIILDACAIFGKPKQLFTLREAVWTMRECKKACRKWMKLKTPGRDPRRARKNRRWG